MESPAGSPTLCPAVHGGGGGEGVREGVDFPQVDPFLVEALQNPRHRLTILRMELDVQRFIQSADQLQLEFQHFPTSYLRCAAHRVAQHYGLQTTVLDNVLDGTGKIIVRKTLESRFPATLLSDIPVKQPENEKTGQPKFVIRSRSSRQLQNSSAEFGTKGGTVKTVEERKEEYDKARARIFNNCTISDFGTESSQIASDGSNLCSTRDDGERQNMVTIEFARNSPEPERNIAMGGSYTVAIFKDREKDRSDPDYDRSYDRYAKGTSPKQNFCASPYNVLQPPNLPYRAGFPQLGHLQPSGQAPGLYMPSNQLMNPYSSVGCNQNPRDAAAYIQWPSPAMIYAHSYRQYSQDPFQVHVYQQSLSFGNSQAL